MSNGDGVSQGDRNRNPARCVSRGSGLQMDLGRAGSPYALPAAFTGTGASNGDATRPQYARRTLRRFGG